MKRWQRLLLLLVCVVSLYSAIIWVAHHYAPKPVTDDKQLTFVYACGYVNGQHRIMDITNVPGPHKPSSSELCVRARDVAKANGFDPK